MQDSLNLSFPNTYDHAQVPGPFQQETQQRIIRPDTQAGSPQHFLHVLKPEHCQQGHIVDVHGPALQFAVEQSLDGGVEVGQAVEGSIVPVSQQILQATVV